MNDKGSNEEQRDARKLPSESTVHDLQVVIPDGDPDDRRTIPRDELSTKLKELAKRHWNVDSFLPLQEPILNAALEQKRDIFVVLPTGGGKSLCYQLPALIETGFALVVSPLVSLIQDQVYDLQKANIPAAMLTGASPIEYIREVQEDMTTGHDQEDKFKLLYVTPEKITQSKAFMESLKQAYVQKRLSRIVIDEAHCCSKQSHAFRPDYVQLNILRNEFPDTRIMALTATCPGKMLQDVISTLAMPAMEQHDGTLVYSAPLFSRPNLKYQVVPKPSSVKETITHMTEWILANHQNETGIVYCFTRKDTAAFAKGIMEESKGKVICRAYHSLLSDDDRTKVHHEWRRNSIHVVVATAGFGLGINHLETRFIIHQSIPTSFENYYQESGRAGRDGKSADSVIYYRDEDAQGLSPIISKEDGTARRKSLLESIAGGSLNLQQMTVYKMIRYAQEYKTCRIIDIGKHLSVDPTLFGSSNRLMDTIVPHQPCGICDNCTRSPGDVVTKDVTMLAVSLTHMCCILEDVNQNTTTKKIIQLVQGKGLKKVNLQYLKSDFSKVDIRLAQRYTVDFLERVISQLLIDQFLKEKFHSTAQKTYSYLVGGDRYQELLEQKVRDDGKLEIAIEISVLQGDEITKGDKISKKQRLA